MNRTILLALLLASTSVAIAQAPAAKTSDWVGVWEGTLEGQPAITVTLAGDAGALGGTVVFRAVIKDGGEPRVLGPDPHVLLDPRLEADRLTFQVIRKPDGRRIHLSMWLDPDGRARIQCSDCGDDAPVAPMEKLK